jgi:hypothetical protein
MSLHNHHRGFIPRSLFHEVLHVYGGGQDCTITRLVGSLTFMQAPAAAEGNGGRSDCHLSCENIANHIIHLKTSLIARAHSHLMSLYSIC